MKVVVTGGAGFIGSHLVERLVRDGHEVLVLDNLSTGNLDNLKSVSSQPNFNFVEMDVSDYARVRDFFKGVDWVFHLAALADIVPSIVEPYKYHHANVNTTVSVLEASRNCRVRRFIYSASSSCYGIPDAYPTTEEAEVRPLYPYAFTKYIAERYCLFWGKVYKLPVVSLRLFNVYGPRQRTTGAYGAVLGVFLAQRLAGAPFTIVGDGQQKRDFIYVTDVVEAMVRAAVSQISLEVFNVGSGNPQSINYLASLIDPSHPRINIPKRPGEPDCTWADIAKIKKMLGWLPAVPLEEGIKRVLVEIQWWKDAPVWTPEKIELATKEWFTYLC
jgi:UDP-glucose 4-epimerase